MGDFRNYYIRSRDLHEERIAIARRLEKMEYPVGFKSYAEKMKKIDLEINNEPDSRLRFFKTLGKFAGMISVNYTTFYFPSDKASIIDEVVADINFESLKS